MEAADTAVRTVQTGGFRGRNADITGFQFFPRALGNERRIFDEALKRKPVHRVRAARIAVFRREKFAFRALFARSHHGIARRERVGVAAEKAAHSERRFVFVGKRQRSGKIKHARGDFIAFRRRHVHFQLNFSARIVGAYRIVDAARFIIDNADEIAGNVHPIDFSAEIRRFHAFFRFRHAVERAFHLTERRRRRFDALEEKALLRVFARKRIARIAIRRLFKQLVADGFRRFADFRFGFRLFETLCRLF